MISYLTYLLGEVNKVGCLERSGLGCELSCAQVEEKIFESQSIKPSFFDGERSHYCGRDAALNFEFSSSLGGTVPLRTGEMDKIANKPEWICSSLKVPILGRDIDDVGFNIGGIELAIPFVGLPYTTSADQQYHGNFFGIPFEQNCIMLSKSKLETEIWGESLSFVGAVFVPFIKAPGIGAKLAAKAPRLARSISAIQGTAGQIKSNVKNVLGRVPDRISAPIVTAGTKLYRAVGLNRIGTTQAKFVQGVLIGEATVSIEDSSSLSDPYFPVGLKSKGGCFTGYAYRLDYGDMINECKFRTTHKGEKITYSVWSAPTVPGIDGARELSKIVTPEDFESLEDEETKSIIKSIKTIDEILVEGKLDDDELSNSETIFNQAAEFTNVPVSEAEDELERAEEELATAEESDDTERITRAKSVFQAAQKKLESVRNSEEANIRRDWNNLGSCAYVVLERDLDVTITTPKVSSEIASITVTTSKDEYQLGETIEITGNLELEILEVVEEEEAKSGRVSKAEREAEEAASKRNPSAGKKVKIEISTVSSEDSEKPIFVVDSKNVVTDEDGNFVWDDSEINDAEVGNTYRVVAEYSGTKSEPHTFVVK